MDAELNKLATWAEPLLAALTTGERFRLSRKIGYELRRSTSRRIAAQRNPDGSAFEPRSKARGKRGKIKRAMFSKIRSNRFMRVRATPEEVAIGFIGRVATIAATHQHGLVDKVSPRGPRHTYAQREILGFTREDEIKVREMVIAALEGKG